MSGKAIQFSLPLMCRRLSPGCLVLYFSTIRHLKAKQIFFYFIRRVLKIKTTIRLPKKFVFRNRISMLKPIENFKPALKQEFVFLNQSHVMDAGKIDWRMPEMPKLWRYNLHYFDYLMDDGKPLEFRIALVTDWIRQNPAGTEDAWEPYTVSLRIVNWIKFYLTRISSGKNFRTILKSLYQQSLWLEKNIEHHILANHYLKNGVALFFAGYFFKGKDARRWLRKGTKIIENEIEEQFLQDGGHYERSPMYHAIATQDLLDILNLITRNYYHDTDFIEKLREKSVKALDFLHGICMPDGDIPLLNDSAFSISAKPERIFEYAKSILDYRKPAHSSGLTAIRYPQSGYFVARNNRDFIIMDCGDIGPDYQPGHAHCDLLSYELMLNGERIVVDAGVHDYEPGWPRSYCRSTRAHNTVMVDGVEQSEIWGSFRVGRRAKPLHADLSMIGDACIFQGAFTGFPKLGNRITHSRTIEFNRSGNVAVLDSISGNGKYGRHTIQSFIHIHPDYRVSAENEIEVRNRNGRIVIRIRPDDKAEINIVPSYYFPEFGGAMENNCIVLKVAGELPLKTGYQMYKQK